jgi:hypothetical protein
MAQADADSIGENLSFPIRLLATPQQRADALLQKWRLGRAAGLPPAFRLDPEDAGQ